MAKCTPILLGEYFENRINEQIKSEKFASTGKIMSIDFRLFEQQEIKTKILIDELKVGEKSGMISNFDGKRFLLAIHAKH